MRGGFRVPDWSEQRVQFLTRYIFAALGFLFFHFSGTHGIKYLTLAQWELILLLYGVINTVHFVHAWRHTYSASRFRFGMWLDILLVSMILVQDPHETPPSLMVYLMVVLGNGMRYGMRLFAESLAGSFVGASIALSVRYWGSEAVLTSGVVFQVLFAAVVLIYAFILMNRIEESRRHLEDVSRRDPLTGMLNRGAFHEVGEQLFQSLMPREEKLVVMFADLDKFKAVNDTLGHAAGDQVLVQFASTLRTCLRASDVAARYGGDEFVLLLPDIGIEDAERVAHRVQSRVAGWIERMQIDLSVSIGLGEAPTHGTQLSELLERVDGAMYRSKAARDTSGGVRCVEDEPAPVEAAASS